MGGSGTAGNVSASVGIVRGGGGTSNGILRRDVSDGDNGSLLSTTTRTKITNLPPSASISSSASDEFPLNVGVFPPPPEFCSNVVPNPAYGNIFISVSLTQDAIDNPDLNIYPDLLNIPNRVIGKMFPVNLASYATLPRNNRQRQQGSGQNYIGQSHHGPAEKCNSRLQNVINYQNLETSHLNDKGAISLCAGCLKSQDHQYSLAVGGVVGGGGGVSGGGTDCVSNNGISFVAPTIVGGGGGGGGGSNSSQTGSEENDNHLQSSMSVYPKYDNMGRRITASGNSTLSLPDEDEEDELMRKEQHGYCDPENNKISGDLPSRLCMPPSGCDYVSL